MKCKMCLSENTENKYLICDSCRSILLNINLNLDGKLNDLVELSI